MKMETTKTLRTIENNVTPPQATEAKIESPEHPKQFKRAETIANDRKQLETLENRPNN